MTREMTHSKNNRTTRSNQLIKPLAAHQQGDLDSLCGIYAIINAVRYLKDIKGWKSQAELMKRILDHMEEKGMTKTTVRLTTDGTLLYEMASALKHIVCPKYKIHRSKPYSKNQQTTLDQFLLHCQAFLEQKDKQRGESKANSKAIILTAIGGKHDHWTLIKQITASRILLYDSSGLSYLGREYCCLRDDELQKTHSIYPTCTYFLWIK